MAFDAGRYHPNGLAMLCKFGKNDVCQRCGRVNNSGVKSLKANCRAVCVHLGEPVTPIKVECQTCKGEKLVEQPAHKCSQFMRCLPAYTPKDMAKWQERPEAEIYHLCQGCDAFSPLLPAPPAE